MKELFDILNIVPNNENIYKTALSHSSYVNEKHLKADYERLEFLGDAVLELISSDYLYNNLDVKEGDMTKLRASYVCGSACYKYALDMGISKFVMVGHGEEEDGGRFKEAILSDIFEALIGALYLDQGFVKTKEIVLDIIVPYIENPDISFFSDYKSKLQEYTQTDKRTLKYTLLEESGPAHDKTFKTSVVIDDITYGIGIGKSKKDAEQNAAKDALEKLAIIDKE